MPGEEGTTPGFSNPALLLDTRTAVFTSGIISVWRNRKIALFFAWTRQVVDIATSFPQECGFVLGPAERGRTEPNSGLDNAISYLLKRWQALTLSLR